MSVEATEKHSDTSLRIKVRYSVYMYDGKMGMHVPANFDLPGKTELCSAWKLWLSVNPGYACTNVGV